MWPEKGLRIIPRRHGPSPCRAAPHRTEEPRMRVRLFNALLILVLLAASQTAFASERAQQSDARYFSETGFRISNDKFWEFFQGRGGKDRKSVV